MPRRAVKLRCKHASSDRLLALSGALLCDPKHFQKHLCLLSHRGHPFAASIVVYTCTRRSPSALNTSLILLSRVILSEIHCWSRLKVPGSEGASAGALTANSGTQWQQAVQVSDGPAPGSVPFDSPWQQLDLQATTIMVRIPPSSSYMLAVTVYACSACCSGSVLMYIWLPWFSLTPGSATTCTACTS